MMKLLHFKPGGVPHQTFQLSSEKESDVIQVNSHTLTLISLSR